MKKIGLICKDVSASRIKSNLKDAASLFIINFSGLSSPEITSLRQALTATRSDMFVVKNSVAKRAFKEGGFESLLEVVQGPSGFIFVKDEPVAASKVLYNFAKEHEKLKLGGGILKDKVLTKDDIEAMAKLPSKEALRAKLVGVLISPVFGLACVLNGNLRKLVVCLDQINKKKGN